MTDTTDKVSLKEHLEQRIDALEKKFEKAEKNRDENLKLQARETERRLLDLNHENARIASFQAVSVTKEIYDRDVKELRALIDVLTLAGTKWVTQDYLAGVLKEPSTDIRDLTKSRDVQSGRVSQQAVNTALFFSIVSALVAIFSVLSRFL